ncbi:polysaccharide biosynthesis tyrosine autokinase [Pirellulaceae bacterium SH501]
MDAIRNPSEPSQPMPPGQRQQTNPDLLKVLWRWKWLPILGAFLGLTIGYLVYGQMPPQYKAMALVQVHSPMRNLPIDNMNMPMESKGKSDELVVIRSLSVIEKAVDSAKLTQHRKLLGKSKEEIIGWIKNKKVLEVKLGSTDPNSEIIQIGITTDDAELSGTILQAVVAGYKAHTSKKLNDASNDAVTVLNKYNDSYLKRQEKVQKDVEKIRQTNDLIFVDGKLMDPSASKLIAMEEQVAVIDSKKRGVESLLEQIRIAQEAGRPIEESLRLIASSAVGTLAAPLDGVNIASEKNDVRVLASAVSQFEDMQVIPIRIKLKQELSNWGEQHPTVKVLRNSLDEVEAKLAEKKAALKEAEENVKLLVGSDQRDIPSLQNQLKNSLGALTEELSKLERERNKVLEDIAAIKVKVQANAQLIGDFMMNLAELEALGKTSKEISEVLNRLLVSTESNQTTISDLEVSSLGGFVGPRIELYLGIGAMLGLALFSGIAYLLELADRSYRSPDEIAVDLGMPIIGHLPLASLSRTKRVDEKVDTSIVTLHKSRSALSEAFRGIRTALFFSCNQGAIKVIQVTSPVPGDGKSTIAANLAVSISQSGRRVCLVDCDFRRPRVAKIFGLREDLGLVQVIGGKAELEDAIQTTTIENLYAVTCGRRPGNPAELLASERFNQLLAELRERFDFVIVDTPPILVVSDPAAVATNVDGVVLTVRLRRNLKPIALRAAQMLHSMNANMIGVVVNGIGVGGNGYGYGGYRYDAYSSTPGYGYGQSGYGGYGYGATYQYGGYYGGTMIGKDYYSDSVPKPVSK